MDVSFAEIEALRDTLISHRLEHERNVARMQFLRERSRYTREQRTGQSPNGSLTRRLAVKDCE